MFTKKEKKRLPFEMNLIRRRAGQSAGEKWRALQENGIDDVIPIVMCGIAFLAISVCQRLGALLPLWLGVVLCVCLVLWAAVKVIIIRREVDRWWLGEKGEQYVGQVLEERLSPKGYCVFHDIIFRDKRNVFNIDHVVVGPKGVFVIETKAWRKRETGRPEIVCRGDRLYEIVRDGRKEKQIDLGKDAVCQVQLNAKEIGRQLYLKTRQKYDVTPILVVAGWYCKNNPKLPLYLINEKGIEAYIDSPRSRIVLRSEQIELVRGVLEHLGEECKA